MKKIDYREICKKNINTDDLPNDTEIVFKEKHPRYILEPFHVVYEGDPEYDKGITLSEATSMIK
ncbi:MAG: hypothetical protein MR759_06175 [Ruminococcus sp.]|nr:hypothetical protein [Ruminococcus sp.]